MPKVFIALGILKTLCFESNIPTAVLYLVKSKVKVNFQVFINFYHQNLARSRLHDHRVGQVLHIRVATILPLSFDENEPIFMLLVQLAHNSVNWPWYVWKSCPPLP